MGKRLHLSDVAAMCPADLAAGSLRLADPAALADTLDQTGWCLLRAGAASIKEFHAVVSSLGIDLADNYGDLPCIGDRGVFRTTPYPADEDLLFHNEASHTPHVPRVIFFYCHRPAPSGGHTPIGDGVRALSGIDGRIADALSRHGLVYRRRFIPGLDVSWQHFFGTTEQADVECLCAQQGLNTTWLEDGALQTEYRTVATGTLPDGRQTMFHQIALHHPAFLHADIREYFRSCGPGGRPPRDVVLGDGSDLPDDWATAIVDAQVRTASFFPWNAGDILVLDNRVFSHARTTYAGERENYVILSRLEAVTDVWADPS